MRIYDARGNRYAVASPAALGLEGPASALAARRADWAGPLLARLGPGVVHAVDGLVIGPFAEGGPVFDALILNTDGSLAERSGNGLTIFARALVDAGVAAEGVRIEASVHHDGAGPSPLATGLTPQGGTGVVVELGQPAYGPQAVAAIGLTGGPTAFTVEALAALDPAWRRSVLVNVGNPHCVTWLDDPAALPDRARLDALAERLQAIAFAPPAGAGRPFARGCNLQWAAPLGADGFAVRIFERGEGWTASSGSSASGVASAAAALGLVAGDRATIQMAGGMATILLDRAQGLAVSYVGEARPL